MHVLGRADFWQASSSSSLESFLLHSSSEPCQAGCRSRKPLPLAACSWSSSSLLQGSSRKRLVSAGLSRIATTYTTDSFVAFESVAALPAERLTENAELDVYRDHADIATLPEAVDIFATSNGSMRFAGEGFAASNGASLLANKEEEEEEETEVLMPFSVKEGTETCLQSLIVKKMSAEPTGVCHGLSFPFSDQDALSSIHEHDIHILEQEELRRKRISEAKKNTVPWNKGKKYNKQGKHKKPAAATNKDITGLDDAELLVKEKQRRQRISTANSGKVPWNKGRQHSEETRRRIRERTTEAMKNPKIREKLRVHASNLSDETKSKISAGMALMWEAKKKLKHGQENCLQEWKEYVADAARIGHGDDEEYEWSSYDTILMDLQKTWRSNRIRRKVKDSKRPMTSDHRIKISNAIKAKWADLSFRSSVEAAIQARWEKRGTEHVKVKRRCRKKQCLFKEKKFHDTVVVRSESDESDDDDDSVPNADSMLSIGPEILQSIQRVRPAYRNPLNNEMLEKLKQIRANRRSKETNRSRVLERARILMEEARMAAKALEAQAATDESALPPLQEAQQLLAEAAESFKAAGLRADFFMETSKGK